MRRRGPSIGVILLLLQWTPAHAWGPHSAITRAACTVLPKSDRLDERLTGVQAMETYAWLGDYREDAFEEYYPDDYLIFPRASRHFGHLLPEVKGTYEPFFYRALQALRTESPVNAARWVGSLLHFQQDSGSPPHALPTGGEMHSRLENWLDAKAIRLGEYRPRLLGSDDRSALDGFLLRMDALVLYSRQRAERALPYCESGQRDKAEPIILDAAIETSRVSADLMHTLLVLSETSSRQGATLRIRVMAPPLPALPKSPARCVLMGTDFATVADLKFAANDAPYLGECVFRNLSPGEYRPIIYRTGCKAKALRPVRLQSADDRMVHVVLESTRTSGNLVRDSDRIIGLAHWNRIGSGAETSWMTAAIPIEDGATYKIGVRWKRNVKPMLRARWDQYVNFGPALRIDEVSATSTESSSFVAPHKARLLRLLILTDRPITDVIDDVWLLKDMQTPVELHAQYCRGSGQVEAKIDRIVTDEGMNLTSRTYRPDSTLTLVVNQTRSGELRDARVYVDAGSRRETTAIYRDGHAFVRRHDKSSQEFECPAGLICTSAPDWTDTVLLCLQYDRVRGGRQEFEALWIHPTQPAQQLRFTAERVGTDRMMWGFLWLEADRLMLTIRGGSRYMAWSVKGRMVKLTPIDRNGGLQMDQSLYLEGYEAGAEELGQR